MCNVFMFNEITLIHHILRPWCSINFLCDNLFSFKIVHHKILILNKGKADLLHQLLLVYIYSFKRYFSVRLLRQKHCATPAFAVRFIAGPIKIEEDQSEATLSTFSPSGQIRN